MIDVPVEVKDALRDGRLKKNYRIVVLDDEGAEDFTIDNNNLVSETINIDERMCSGNKIKFGLCEGSSLEFQYFGFPSILGKRLQVFIDVEYGSENPYTIPMGFFDVQKCSRQASTGIIKAICYNKLQSEYLDAKANNVLLASFDGDSSTNLFLYDIQRTLLKDYAITDRSVIPIPIPSEQEPASFSRVDLDLFFSKGADVETPLSGYLFNQSLRDYTPYTPQNIIGKETLLVFYTNNVTVTTTASQYWLLYSLKKHLNVFVNNLVEYITDLVYGAGFKKNASATAALYSREEIASKLQNATNLIYITIYSGGVLKSYTLLRDAEKQIDNISKLVHHENATIQFTFPSGIGLRAMGNEHGSGTTCYDVMGASLLHSYQYKYYINNTWTEETKTAPAPEIRFWDGSLYNGVINEILCIGDLVLSDAEKIPFTIGDIPEFTLRDIVSANYETACQFGQLSRLTDLFSGVELNHSRLYPQETLYPDNALYPDGAQASATKSMYSQLWADEGNVRKWRNLLITYKGLDENQQEKDFVYTAEVNSDGTDDYDCSDNWLFRNLVWTQAQIEEYATAMVAKMQDMTWFPFEMWCPGLPYLETGDEIEIPLGQNSYTSYVLQRQLKGIQNLQDTYINGTLDIF